MSRRSRIVIAAAAGFMAFLWCAPSLAADNLVPTATYSAWCQNSAPFTGGICQTDNYSFTVFHESSVSATGWSHITHALNGQFAPTTLSVVYSSTPTYTGTSETDLIYQVRTDVPPGNDGYTWCNNAASLLRCDQQYSAFRANSLITDGLACHETGHAIGLLHGQEASPRLSNSDPSLGCMVKYVGATTGLGSNNINEIDATYV
jgi:hypothetical protein